MKNKKITFLIVAAVIIIAVVAFVIYGGTKESNKETQSNQTTISSTTKSDSETTKNTTVLQTTTESIKSSSENNQNNIALPLTVNDAMDLLQERYGKSYTVNSTVEENGINYFAIYKNNVKYASVGINLATGETTETITETNVKTDFYLN